MNSVTSQVKHTFKIEDLKLFKQKAFAWASQFQLLSYLDSNAYKEDPQHSHEGLIAVGQKATLVKEANDTSINAFDQLKNLHQQKQDWLFGFMAYDLKNEVERLSSKNEDNIGMPDLLFFQPEIVIEIFEDDVTIHSKATLPEMVFQQIEKTNPIKVEAIAKKPEVKARLSKEYYLKSVEAIRQHIIEGDIYEMNFCQEFFAEAYDMNPEQLFLLLNDIGKAPFSAFVKWQDKYLCCASPERFIKKIGNKLISQPIKGTIKRGKSKVEDLQLQDILSKSEKDQAENVMIVDLVRNDLSRSCKAGSVKVDELFGIYAYEQVHHMISTISGELRDDVHFVDAIRNAFPMGSMTGAPKVMSMQLIEQYEKSRRGLYSGAVGYIRPNGDFDFNVVIRSVLYNAVAKYLSFQVGGAIVFNSEPDLEYEECLLKAKGILTALGLLDKA